MRLWSLHPQYLDTKGLLAAWREALLAKHVLEGKTKGYRNHPQLIRFKNSSDPVSAINFFLSEIFLEAKRRNFRFDRSKIDWNFSALEIPVTRGQAGYEWKHLLKKLSLRDPKKFSEIHQAEKIFLHPLFAEIEGEIEPWEIISAEKNL